MGLVSPNIVRQTDPGVYFAIALLKLSRYGNHGCDRRIVMFLEFQHIFPEWASF